MQVRRKLICVLTALLLGVVLICVTMETETDMLLYAEVSSAEKTEQIQLFEDENGAFYLFLPSYAQLEQTRIRLNTTVELFLNGKLLENGMSCDELQPGEAYDLNYNVWGKECRSSLTILKSGNVAAMYIDTESGAMDYIHQEKGNKETGEIRIYGADGEDCYAGELEFIKGRGNYTWTEYEKKPYSLKLEEAADLLGLGVAQKWILLANAGDASNIRNEIVYTFAKDLGMEYTPDTGWVDLYLNGEYVGLYQLSERNEVHAERVDIAQEGSFLVSIETESRLKFQNYPYVLTDANQALRIHYPEEPAEEAIEGIRAYVQSVENAILSEDGIDPETGETWMELIDLDSWAKKYLIEEMFGNGDAAAISQFFYLDADSRKIYAGPVWDYDRTMGSTVAWHLQQPQTFFANRLHLNQSTATPWMYSLYRNTIFYERMLEIYQSQCLPLLNELLTDHIWSYEAEISAAAAMDALRWQKIDSDPKEACADIVSYMSQRIAFLNRVWLEGTPYYEVQADQGFGSHYAHYVVFQGESLPELPEFEDTEYNVFVGWYDAKTDEPVDTTSPVTENMEIYAKWEDSTYKRHRQILKMTPLGLLMGAGVLLLWVELRRWRKSG